ncbi:NnrU family protein [Pseudohalioglobus sediminis]|uniref:NnrU family protein n=1 Tax=Pseudohalioglobus sediminis TaxID=2606449 RepID=A0A5B0WSY3_9GAMM|nr:NnrU family protein [Pseudohalioglobus sediminis]KAA1189587.1 NnrU family protein [Pseudohalioglobus sediminis]
MALLIAGVLLWSIVHLVPAIAQALRQSLLGKLGENGYKGLFSLLLIAAILMMVFGWRSIDQPTYLYTLPLWTRHLGMLLVLVAFILFVASGMATRIKQVLRHPQLTGVLIWAGAHLMMNGDSRSLVLFGGMGIWALLEIVLINRRDGAWVKPEVPGMAQEAKLLAISLVVFVAVVFAHPWLAGVAIR